MTISLQDFINGDLVYITKHNQNNAALRLAINALQTALGVSGATTGPFLNALFGSQVALIGSSSYVQSTASTTLTLSAGYEWRPDLGSIVYKGSTTAINFSGQTAATYYILIDASGVPSIQTASTFATYSVVWTGSAFGAITLLVPVIWSFSDLEAAILAPFAVSVSDSPGASVNDYAPTGWNAALTRRLLITANAGNTTITGIDSTGVQDGARILLRNPSATDNLILPQANTGSLAANRFDCPGGSDFWVPPKSKATLDRMVNVWVPG